VEQTEGEVLKGDATVQRDAAQKHLGNKQQIQRSIGVSIEIVTIKQRFNSKADRKGS